VREPQLHLPPEVALEYASGTSSEAVALAAASHLTFCATCRATVAEHERMGQALIELLPGTALEEGSLERILARLDEPAPLPPVLPAPPALPEELRVLPLPVQGYLAAAPDRRWRMLAPGVRAVDLPLAGSLGPPATARLIRFRPGYVIPLHDHGGAEYTLVLSGSIEERGERALPGDLIVRAPSDRHTQRIGEDEACIALLVTEGPLIPLTFKGRLLKLITGI
jgi:putative transcriptional regulator